MLNKVQRTVKIGDTLVHGVEIDWAKRDWKRIYTPEEEMERVGKMLRLNGGPHYDPATERLLAASFQCNLPARISKEVEA